MNERIRSNNNLDYNFSNLESMQKSSSTKIAFFGGCMTSLTPGITASMKKIFNFYNEDYTIVDETDAFCCGRPLYLSGQKQAYFELMKYSREKILSGNPRLIITSCPICLNSFRTNYMFPVPVIHHSQYLDSKLKLGEFAPVNSRQKTIYHDPCELSRFQDIYREPRNLLSGLVDLQNSKYNKENQFCCGGSVADGESDFKDKSLIAAKSIKQLIKPDTKLLATACPACKITFKTADILPVMDISEIFVESLNMEIHTNRLRKKSLHYQTGF
jgi:Fe-S oxidoreductase